MVFCLFYIACFICVTYGQTNLFQNGDFESGSNGDWKCQGGCSLTIDHNISRNGSYSAFVTNRRYNLEQMSKEMYKVSPNYKYLECGTTESLRDQVWKGAYQDLNVIVGKMYKITAYVRLANIDENKLYQSVKMMMRCTYGSSKVYRTWGLTPYVRPGRWVHVGGVHRIDEGRSDCRIYIATDEGTNYYLDDAVAVHIPDDNNWKTVALQRIEELRKANISIRLSGANVDTSMVDIKLNQTKMEFPLGTVMNAERIVDTEDASNLAYQQVFYDNFEWGVLGNALKWKQMQPTEAVMNSDKPLNAMNAMQAHGMKQRCHCAFWGVDDRVQDWVKELDADALKAAVIERIDNVTALTNGMCEHWDVNNEQLHGDFYERSTQDVNITAGMFDRMNQKASGSVLYLNDYNVLNNGISTVALKEAALKFKDDGIPIGGIGVQGHMHIIDIPLMKARLDILQEADINVMITEFAINEVNDNIKAKDMDDTLTLFFSHPAVEGVLFWGFWDGRIWEEDAYFFTGPKVTPNAAGKVYQNLFHNVWRTRALHTLLGEEPYNVRGFMGEYSLTVSYKGETLATQTFTLTDEGQYIDIQLNGESGSSPSVSQIVTN